MNEIEAAKAAGWTQTAIDMASKQEIERLERFAQVIRNQALEDAAKKRAQKPRKLPRVGSVALLEEQQFCYELGFKEGAASVRSVIRSMKKDQT